MKLILPTHTMASNRPRYTIIRTRIARVQYMVGVWGGRLIIAGLITFAVYMFSPVAAGILVVTGMVTAGFICAL